MIIFTWKKISTTYEYTLQINTVVGSTMTKVGKNIEGKSL